jgi:hypothetical protein
MSLLYIIISVLVLLIFVLIVKYRNKRDEMFSDFDDILDAKCDSISSGKKEYIWDLKKCGPHTCESEICHVLIKNEDNNAYNFRKRSLNKKKVMVNGKIDVFKCISNHSPESNIYCHPNQPPACYQETRDCFLWDDNTSKWNANIYQKVLNSGGECKWYNQTYPTGSGVEVLPRECRPDILDCSACNLKCNYHNNEYETWRYDKINDSCYKHNECQTCGNSDNREEGYFFNYSENRYDKVVFLQNEVDCSYSYSAFDGSTEYCHPMHTTGSTQQCERAGWDVLDNEGKYYYINQGGTKESDKLETRNCANLLDKTCLQLDQATQTIISKEYEPELASDRRKCQYVSKTDKNDVKDIDGDTISCDGIIGSCKNIDEYVDFEKRKCVKCPGGEYLEDRLATTYETACKPIPENNTDPVLCWEPDPSNQIIDRLIAYPYVNVLKYNEGDTTQIEQESQAPPDCEVYDNDETGIDILGNKIRDRCSILGASTCENCKYDMSSCRFNPDTGLCGCSEECDSGIYKCLDNINGNEFRDYRLHQEDPFSPCILKSDYGITMEQQECISECPISKSKFESEDGTRCIIPDCVVETKYYFSRFNEYIKFPFDTSVFGLSKTNEEYFSDFLEEDTAINLMCDIEELTKVVYLKKKSEDPNLSTEEREKYQDQTKCVYGNAIYPSSSSPQDLNTINTTFNSEVGFILEQTSKKRQNNLCPQDCVVIETTPINQLCKNSGNYSLADGTRCIKDPRLYGEYDLQDEVSFEIIEPSVSTGKSCIQAAEDYFQNYKKIRTQSVDGLEKGQLVRFQVECENVKECPQDCVEEWSCGACGYSSYNPIRICDRSILKYPEEGGKPCSDITSKSEYCDPPPDGGTDEIDDKIDDEIDETDSSRGPSLPICNANNEHTIIYRNIGGGADWNIVTANNSKFNYMTFEEVYNQKVSCDSTNRNYKIGKYMQWDNELCTPPITNFPDTIISEAEPGMPPKKATLVDSYCLSISLPDCTDSIQTHYTNIFRNPEDITNENDINGMTYQEAYDDGVEGDCSKTQLDSDTHISIGKYYEWNDGVCTPPVDAVASSLDNPSKKATLVKTKCFTKLQECSKSSEEVYLTGVDDTVIYTLSDKKYTKSGNEIATEGDMTQPEQNIINNIKNREVVSSIEGSECPQGIGMIKVRKYKQWIKQASDECAFSADQSYDHTFSNLYVAGDTVKLEFVEEKCVSDLPECDASDDSHINREFIARYDGPLDTLISDRSWIGPQERPTRSWLLRDIRDNHKTNWEDLDTGTNDNENPYYPCSNEHYEAISIYREYNIFDACLMYSTDDMITNDLAAAGLQWLGDRCVNLMKLTDNMLPDIEICDDDANNLINVTLKFTGKSFSSLPKLLEGYPFFEENTGVIEQEITNPASPASGYQLYYRNSINHLEVSVIDSKETFVNIQDLRSVFSPTSSLPGKYRIFASNDEGEYIPFNSRSNPNKDKFYIHFMSAFSYLRDFNIDFKIKRSDLGDNGFIRFEIKKDELNRTEFKSISDSGNGNENNDKVMFLKPIEDQLSNCSS